MRRLAHKPVALAYASAGAVFLQDCRNLALRAFVNKPQPFFQLLADSSLLNFKHITASLAAAEESRANIK